VSSTIQTKLSPETQRHKGAAKDENEESKDLLAFLIESNPPSSLCLFISVAILLVSASC
jgi:hypothetical protein